jgi:uncharacterized membrane protein
MSGRRWLTVGFTISLLINLFFIGIVVGRLTFPAFLLAVPPQAGLVPRAEIRQLPVSERIAFARVIRRHAGELKALHEKIRDAKLDAEKAVGAPTYDRKLLEKRFAAVRDAQLAQQVASHAAVIEALSKLSAQSRATIARQAEQNVENAP